MIKYYTSRELAQKLNINLAKWKRWSREFLPPDPLGGMQSGYARQYRPDDAFTVLLGGHLVSELKFAIPEAKTILADLHPWLREKGFTYDIKGNAAAGHGIETMIKSHLIFIRYAQNTAQEELTFHYTVRGIIANQAVQYQGFEVMEELYTESFIGLPGSRPADPDTAPVRTLNITGVLKTLVTRLELDRIHYPVISQDFS